MSKARTKAKVLKNLNVHIVGGTGQMGSWLKKFLESQEIQPTVSDEDSHGEELISQADIIFFSVPIDIAPKVIQETVKKAKQKTLLIDLSSIKYETTKILEKVKNPAISLHFLFGPNISSVQNQNMVLIPIRENDISKNIIKLFKKNGALVLEMTSREHDYQMAHIQALTHFVNLSFAKILVDNKINLDSKTSTPIFLSQISVASRVLSQNSELISLIQMSNPYFSQVSKKLLENQTQIIELIQKKDKEKLEELYQKISLNLEPESLEKNKNHKVTKKIKALKVRNKFSMSYLGPEGTFSHHAATQIATDKTSLVPAKTIYDIFYSVSNEKVDFGLVPAENSIEGTIRETLDFLVEFGLKVNLEISLEVHQNILSKEKDLSRIKRVISHSQAIAQSREWLEKNLPNATIEYSQSTIASVNETLKDSVAIIGSELASKIYKLNILAKNIETQDLNITRFYIVSKNLFALKEKPSKTLIFLTVFNKVGILRDILNVFADFDINLNKLESRPSKEKNWDYYFYVEVESAIGEPRLTQALGILKQFCPRIEILGEY